MKDLYTDMEFDDIPSEVRVARVEVGSGENEKVFFVTSRKALDALQKEYGSYQATIVRDGQAPWDSEKQGFI